VVDLLQNKVYNKIKTICIIKSLKRQKYENIVRICLRRDTDPD